MRYIFPLHKSSAIGGNTVSIVELLKLHPVIAAVKDNESLQVAVKSDCRIISVLYGNICNIGHIVQQIKMPVNMPSSS